MLTVTGGITTAIVLAVVTSGWLVLHPPSPVIVNGPWQTSMLAGSPRADIYTRAYVAITALFSLDRSETIYFAAMRDDENEPLRAACTYAIEGKSIAARWWSITAYGDDNFLIPNEADRFSFNMSNLKYGPDGVFHLLASPVPQLENWLPTGRGGGFNLMLRLYIPGPDIATNPGEARLPSIKRLGNCG